MNMSLTPKSRIASWLPSRNSPKDKAESLSRAPRHAVPRVTPGQEPQSKYVDLDSIVGEGTTATVRLAKRQSDGSLVAIKEFQSFGKDIKRYRTNILAEYYIAHGLRHENIVQTFELLQNAGFWSMVMEYAPYNLFDRVSSKAVDARLAGSCFTQLIHGVAYIHAAGFAHRDLKLENILLTRNGVVKIIDFGTVSTGKIAPTTRVGSDPYIAPELFTASTYSPQLADVWSLAIIYLCMVLQRFPWKIATAQDPKFSMFLNSQANTTTHTTRSDLGTLLGATKHPQIRVEVVDLDASHITDPIYGTEDWLMRQMDRRHQDLIRRMLRINPSARINMPELSNLLQQSSPPSSCGSSISDASTLC